MNYWKRFIGQTLTAIAALSAFVTLLGFCFGDLRSLLGADVQQCCQEPAQTCYWIPWLILLAILLISAGFAYWVCREPKQITLKLQNEQEIIIKKGDILKEKGCVVIPMNEYFDTKVDEKIISSESLHGQFIKLHYDKHVDDLDAKIEDALKNEVSETTERKDGKQKKYPLGTSIHVNESCYSFILFALTHFDEDNHAFFKDRQEYHETLLKLFDNIEKLNQSEDVYMPLVGRGFARLEAPDQRLLVYILDCLAFIKPISLSKKLYIVLKSDSDVSLSKIEQVFKASNKI